MKIKMYKFIFSKRKEMFKFFHIFPQYELFQFDSMHPIAFNKNFRRINV